MRGFLVELSGLAGFRRGTCMQLVSPLSRVREARPLGPSGPQRGSVVVSNPAGQAAGTTSVVSSSTWGHRTLWRQRLDALLDDVAAGRRDLLFPLSPTPTRTTAPAMTSGSRPKRPGARYVVPSGTHPVPP